MNRFPPYRHPLLLPATAAVLLAFLGGCATKVSENLTEESSRTSVDAVAEMIRNGAGTSEATPANSNTEQAWAFVEARDCEQAMPIALVILSEQPDSMDGRLLQAECAAIADDATSAEESYTQILATEREPRALRGLGVLMARAGQYDEAQMLLLEASVAGPDDWRTWNALGFVSDIEEDWEGAAQAYERAAYLAPTEAAPLNNLGLSYLQQGETASAINAFNQAINRDPEFAAAAENLRMALIFDGQLESALWGVPEDQRPVILNNAGVVARSQGNTELAAELFQQALHESPVFYEKAYNNLRALDLPGHQVGRQ